MDHHLIICVVIVMQPWLILTKNKIWLKTHHVMKEATELIHLRSYCDVRARMSNQVFFKF